MESSSPNKSYQAISIFDLMENDADEDDDDYHPVEEEEEVDEEEDIMEDQFMGDPIRSGDIEMSESEIIARRTRSKVQIEEEPKDTLEFPDVTEDLYEPMITVDDEWKLFCNSLFQDNPTLFLDDDDANADPDYNVINQRVEKPTEPLVQEDSPVVPVERIDVNSLSSSEIEEWSKVFQKSDIEILYHQMSQHVQLLVQQYILTMTSQTLGNVAEKASSLIKEIDSLAQGKTNSLFKVPNLTGALDIINNYPIKLSDITVTANSWRQCPVPLTARPIIANNPIVFPYHNLLPRNGYPDITVCEYRRKRNLATKIKFNRAEDHLIALGLEQFKDVDKKHIHQYIKQLLLPVKSVEQIKTHIKNMKRYLTKKCDDSNPLIYYLKHGKLQPVKLTIPQPKFDYSNPSDLPEWLAKYLDPSFTSSLKPKAIPRLKISPIKGTYSLKYPTTASSPSKQANIVLRRYRYLSKLPYIKPKPLDLNQPITPMVTTTNTSSGITLVPIISSSLPLHINQVGTNLLSSQANDEPIAITSIETDNQKVQVQHTSPSPTSRTVEEDGEGEVEVEVEVEAGAEVEIEGEEEGEEKIEETTSWETLNEAPNNLPSSPGQSTNLTSMSDSPTDLSSVDKDEQMSSSIEKEPDALNQNEDDDESDLVALMMASSTITSNRGKNKSHDAAGGQGAKKEAKKSQTTKHKESTILLLSEDWLLNDCNREQKEQLMVQCFISKVREVLKSDDDYIQFLTYLSEFGNQRTSSNGTNQTSIKELHRKTERLLRKVNAQQVMEDFILLLNASEAQECGKMYQYLHWRRYLSFIRKLEVYSAVEPNCIPRLHKTLIQLKSSETPINKQRLKAAVSKAISGHPYLINEFSSLFLDEKPKDYLFAGDEDFDNIVITNQPPPAEIPTSTTQPKEMDNEIDRSVPVHDELFENVLIDLNAEERKYGTNECPCKICHNNTNSNTNSNINNNLVTTASSTEDGISVTANSPTSTTNSSNNNTNCEANGSTGEPESTKRNHQSLTAVVPPPIRHCAACSLKFIGGKIYLQGLKKIQSAEVQYTQLSKESRSLINTNSINQSNPELPQKMVNPSSVSSNQDLSINLTTQSSPGTLTEEPPNHHSNSDNPNEKAWSLAEDKLLLEFCKAKVSSESEANLIELFQEIASQLNRSCDNVFGRFNKLMELFKNETIATHPTTSSTATATINIVQETNEVPTAAANQQTPETVIVVQTDPN